MYTILVPSYTTDKEIEDMKKLYMADYIRVEPMPTTEKKVAMPHWKANLVKNGVRV